MTEDLAKAQNPSRQSRVVEQTQTSTNLGCLHKSLHQSVEALDQQIKQETNVLVPLSFYYEPALLKVLLTNKKPSHPPSAFCIYTQRRRDQILAEVPGLPQKKIMKQVIREWKHMDQTDFKDEAREIYVQYRLMNRWWKEEVALLEFSKEDLDEEIKLWNKMPSPQKDLHNEISEQNKSQTLSQIESCEQGKDSSAVDVGAIRNSERPLLGKKKKCSSKKRTKTLKPPSLKPKLQIQQKKKTNSRITNKQNKKEPGSKDFCKGLMRQPCEELPMPRACKPIFRVLKKREKKQEVKSFVPQVLPILPPCSFVIGMASRFDFGLEGLSQCEKVQFSNVVFHKK